MQDGIGQRPADADALIENLYEAVGSPDQMRSALVAVRDAANAATLVLFSLPNPSSIESRHFLVSGVSRRAVVEYETHFFRHDPWVDAARSIGIGPGQLCVGHELVAPDRLSASYFGREFLAPQRLHDVLSGFMKFSDDVAIPDIALSFHKRIEQGFFERREQSLLQDLIPHCQRALRMHHRLAPQLALGSTLREVFQHSDAPMFFVTEQGRMLDCNASGKAAVGCSGSSASISLERPAQTNQPGVLSVRMRNGWVRLSEVMKPLCTDEVPSLRLAVGTGDAADEATVTIHRAYQSDSEFFTGKSLFAIATLRGDSRAEAVRLLASRFALSPAETETLRRLGAGESPAQVAGSMQVRITTVRTHLASIMSKTGTHSQAQVLSLLVKLGSSASAPDMV